MATFDSNTWYQIIHDSDATVLGTGGAGPTAIHPKSPNITEENQQWQILSSTSSDSSTNVFLLRNHILGVQFYLNTFCADESNCAGQTYAAMSTSDTPAEVASNQEWLFADDGSGDGAFHMINFANGTNYFLDVDGATVLIDSDTGSSSNTWTFSSIGNINDADWSTTTTSTTSAAVTSQSTSTTASNTISRSTSTYISKSPTNTSPASSTSAAVAPSHSTHLNTSALVGGVIGAIALMVLLTAVFVLFQRRRRRRPSIPYPLERHDLGPTGINELPAEPTTWSGPRVELAQRHGPVAELYDYRSHPAELTVSEKEPVERAAEVSA